MKQPAQLEALFRTLLALSDEIEPPSFSGQDRRTMAGHITGNSPRFIREIVERMSNKPGLYRDIPYSGQEIAACQQRAEWWSRVRDVLGQMQQIAADAYLRDQSVAMKASVEVLRKSRNEIDGSETPAQSERAQELGFAAFLYLQGTGKAKPPRRPGSRPVKPRRLKAGGEKRGTPAPDDRAAPRP